jgi:hypothetical protein
MTGQISADGYWMWDGAQWVPNPNRPVAVPAPAAPYESARFRAGVTSTLFAANVVGVVLITAASLALDLITAPNDQQTLVIGGLTLIALLLWVGTFIPAAVSFCMWLHRAVSNMPALGAPDPRWSPTRAVVYCFVPFVWLVHPLWSVLDAWRGSDPTRRWLDRGMRRSISAPPLLFVWWGSWLIGNYVFSIGTRASGQGAAVFDLVGGACLAAAAVLGILVLREVTARQEGKNHLIASGQLV